MALSLKRGTSLSGTLKMVPSFAGPFPLPFLYSKAKLKLKNTEEKVNKHY